MIWKCYAVWSGTRCTDNSCSASSWLIKYEIYFVANIALVDKIEELDSHNELVCLELFILVNYDYVYFINWNEILRREKEMNF